MEEKNKIVGGTLYLVGTPIGNLSDLSDRAKKVFREVDFIAAEDTRNSAKLLSVIGVKKELVSYHEHNKKSSGERLIERLLSGESCALITDAGMPAISDPGEDVVRLCADAGVTVTAVPGPCAAVTALALSGLSTSRFTFEGFLSANRGERLKRLEATKNEERTMIFYEAPHKLQKTLNDMAECFGPTRKIALCRELTKLNEEIVKTTLSEAIRIYSEKEPRGEFVLIVEGSSETAARESEELSSLPPEEHVKRYEDEGLSRMDAIKKAARDRGMSKSELYKILNF